MKSVFVRKFVTNNAIVSPDGRNYKKELMLDIEQDVFFNKEDKIKFQAIDDDYVVIKDIKYNLDENVKEIHLESKKIKASTEQKFLSQVQSYYDRDWYEK